MVSLMTLTVVMLIVGVWALKTVNFTVGGNLSYIAPGIEATISKGTMSNGVWVNAGDASTKMPLTQITRTDTEESLEEKFSYWQDLNLNFNETGDDVTITFSITNDMADKYLSINVTTSYASADNATISLNSSSANLAPDASQSFIITMKVTDKTSNATLSAFAIVFHMEMTEPTKDVSEYPTLQFCLTNRANKTVSVQANPSNLPTGDLVIPSKIISDGVEYTVTSIPFYQSDEPGEEEIISLSPAPKFKEIDVPHKYSLVSSATNAFYGCTGLTSVTIPDSVISIGLKAFFGCASITSITLPNSVTSIATSTFYGCTSLISINIPNAVTSIGDSAFYGCTSLTSITIPDSVTSIGTAFSGCTGLTSITIPASVTSIDGHAFVDCTGLSSIIIPGKVTSIGEYAFSRCTSLASVTIGSGVTSIGEEAFSGCTSLTTMTVKATSVPTGGNNMFKNCPLTTGIFVPSTSVSKYKSATNWKNYSTYIKAGNF